MPDWFINPPLWLSWLGVLALAVGALMLPQAIWGRPRLQVRVGHMETDDQRMVIFEVLSAPLTNRLGLAIGVYRRSVASVANLTVVDANTNTLVASWIPEIKSGIGTSGHRMVIEPSVLVYQILVAVTNKDGTSGLVARDGSVPLNPGIYRVQLDLWADKHHSQVNRFDVGKEMYELHWEEPSS